MVHLIIIAFITDLFHLYTEAAFKVHLQVFAEKCGLPPYSEHSCKWWPPMEATICN